jgi:hypothetical protein
VLTDVKLIRSEVNPLVNLVITTHGFRFPALGRSGVIPKVDALVDLSNI